LAIANLIVCADRVTKACAKDAATLEGAQPLMLHLAEAVLGANNTLPELAPAVRILDGIARGAPTENANLTPSGGDQ
jgi:hypothetical protein